MSLQKAIKHGKEHSKPYTDSKAFDKSCRNHGGCDFCKDNRLDTIANFLDEYIIILSNTKVHI